jgi:hypothetical protein
LLLLVSFVTAPYGAWPFDMVLLLPAATAMIVNHVEGHSAAAAACPDRARIAVWGLIAVNLGCLLLNLLKFSSFYFLWVSPAVLLLYAVVRSGSVNSQHPVQP